MKPFKLNSRYYFCEWNLDTCHENTPELITVELLPLASGWLQQSRRRHRLQDCISLSSFSSPKPRAALPPTQWSRWRNGIRRILQRESERDETLYSWYPRCDFKVRILLTEAGGENAWELSVSEFRLSMQMYDNYEGLQLFSLCSGYQEWSKRRLKREGKRMMAEMESKRSLSE